MKIIIIGGGIGGLAAYHALRKHLPPSTTTVTVYEAYPTSHSTTTVIGGGLGLQPNGQRAIAAISPSSLEYVRSRGVECSAFTFRNERGETLGVMTVGYREKHGYASMMAPRAVVHEGFLAGAGVEDGEVRWGKRVKEVKEFDDHVEVVFEDGEVDTGDLVIGADGVRSVCKEALFGERYPPKYDGLTGIGGFLPVSALSPTLQAGIKEEKVTMTFSRSGFFGMALCTPPSSTEAASSTPEQIMWWSTYESDPPLPRDTPPSRIRDDLLARHSDWKSPYDEPGKTVFRDIITLSCTDTETRQFLVLPRYITPMLPRWSTASKDRNAGGRIVLLGDAAHTMPPDSGQGVSCAVEDGLALALLLKQYLSEPKDAGSSESTIRAIRNAVLAYEEIRKPRVEGILKFAKRSGDGKREMGWVGEKLRDWGLWIFTKLPSWVVHDKLYGYDVTVEVEKYVRQGSQ